MKTKNAKNLSDKEILEIEAYVNDSSVATEDFYMTLMSQPLHISLGKAILDSMPRPDKDFQKIMHGINSKLNTI